MANSKYPLGQGVRLNARFREDGVLTSPTDVELTVRSPAGVDTVYTCPPDSVIGEDSAGVFHAELEPASEGLWLYRWVGIDPSAVLEGRFEVYSIFTAGPTGLQRSYTYDLSTAIGEVRLNINDNDLSRVGEDELPQYRSAVFADEELAAFLTRRGDDVMRATALALRVLAANKNLLAQSRRIGPTTVDYGSVRDDLLKQAAGWEVAGRHGRPGIDGRAR